VIKRSIKVSVTSLADFSCRVGDLELTGNIGPSAREGMRAHQKIQTQRLSESDPVTFDNESSAASPSLESESRLRIDIEVEGVSVALSGRVDLLDSRSHRISEIKTTLVPASRLSESQVALQWAQLKLYGFCYGHQLKADGKASAINDIELELIHADIRADQEYSDTQRIAYAELNEFALDALVRYVQWHKILWQAQADTKESAASIPFPFEPYRAGQRDMAAAVFRSARDGETLLCEAPTGTGKTLSSLFPVVKALGEGYVKHAVYLTAKTSGRESAMLAIRSLEQVGLKIS